MKKDWYKSMTFWGAVLLAIEAGFFSISSNYPTFYMLLEPYVLLFGSFLTLFGFRRALK